MFASWSNLFIQPEYDAAGNFISDGPSVRPATYLALIGIALFAYGAFLGLRLSSRERAGGDTHNPLALAAFRLGNLSVIIALAGGAIFAIVNFLEAFGGRSAESLGERFSASTCP